MITKYEVIYNVSAKYYQEIKKDYKKKLVKNIKFF